MLTELLLILLAVLLYMLLVAIKLGFNEVIKGLESIDSGLRK